MLYTILLQGQASPGGGYGQIIFLVGIVIVFYFFMIRPQQKKAKQQKKFLEEVQKGDSVVTIGGMHGKIVSVDEETVTLDVDRGTKITFQKSSISMEGFKGTDTKS